jgi:hypothetical protein
MNSWTDSNTSPAWDGGEDAFWLPEEPAEDWELDEPDAWDESPCDELLSPVAESDGLELP